MKNNLIEKEVEILEKYLTNLEFNIKLTKDQLKNLEEEDTIVKSLLEKVLKEKK